MNPIDYQLQKFRKEYHKKLARKKGLDLLDDEIDLSKSDAQIQKMVNRKIRQLKGNNTVGTIIFIILLITFLVFQLWIPFAPNFSEF